MHNAGAKLIEDQFLVVDVARVCAVSAAQNRGGDSVRREPLDDCRHDWGLAGSASRQIADTDDRNGSRMGGEQPRVVRQISGPNGRTVKDARGCQPAASQTRNGSARTARDQVAVAREIHAGSYRDRILRQMASAICWVPTAVGSLR